MKIDNYLENATALTLRTWLDKNAKIETSCWVNVSITAKEGVLLYLDAVEIALCYGWIDGVKKKNNQGQLMQRLSPRKKNSNWTELNKQRVRRLETLGLMQPGGYLVLPEMDVNTFVVDEYILTQLAIDPVVLKNFNNFPKLYQRIRIDTIQQVRGEETYYKRIDKLIENTRNNKMYGQWNDNGRLA